MDVTCDRCNTRYEFDAALVSDRGTTVKCTNCGHQFRVHRPTGSGSFAGWTIRTVDGRELHYQAMRELQAAISHHEVTLQDVLIPSDGTEPKRLGRIEELQSFFAPEEPEHITVRRKARRGNTQPPQFEDELSLVKTNVVGSGAPDDLASSPGVHVRDRDGDPLPSRSGTTLRPPGPPPGAPRGKQGSIPPAFTKDDEAPNSEPTRVRAQHLPPDPPTLAERGKRREGGHEGKGGAEVPPDEPSASTHEAVEALNKAVNDMLQGDAPSSLRGLDDDADEQAHKISDDDTIGEPDAEPRVSHQPKSSERPASESLPPLSPTPSVVRPSILRRSEFTDPRFSAYSPRGKRPGMARWLFGVIALGVLAVVGFTLFKRYVLPTAAPTTSGSASIDERVTKLIEEGESRLLDGDVESAKDQYLKASGIAEHDPRIALGIARIEVIRADFVWLHMRLLGDDAPDRAAVGQQLARAIERAEKATSSAASAHATTASGEVGLQIDLLRLKGKGGEARQLVSKLDKSDGDGARVLAALDLIESSPNYSALIDRLRSAIRAERKLGRAHAMLVYALARAGKKADASAELEALASATPKHALLEPLKRYVAAAEEGETDTADSAGADPDAPPASYKDALERAAKARKAGDLDRAERFYEVALDKKRGSAEALAGLADVARDRGDTEAARKRYEELLDNNPDYVPALAGLADLDWASGKRADAVTLYRKVVRKAPDSAYAKHARARIAAAAAPPPTTAPDPQPDTAPQPQPPVDPHTHVDTSDLPPEHKPDPSPQPAPEPQPEPAPHPPGIDTTDLPE